MPLALLLVLSCDAISIVVTLSQGSYFVGTLEVGLVLGLLARQPWARQLALVSAVLSLLGRPVLAYLTYRGMQILATTPSALGQLDGTTVLLLSQVAQRVATLLIFQALLSAGVLAALFREEVKEWFSP